MESLSLSLSLYPSAWKFPKTPRGAPRHWKTLENTYFNIDLSSFNDIKSAERFQNFIGHITDVDLQGWKKSKRFEEIWSDFVGNSIISFKF